MVQQYDVFYKQEEGLTLSDNTAFAYTEPEPMETCWQCPETIGNGRFHQITIRQGFQIWISDCTFHGDIVGKHIDLPPLLQFTFIESGHFQVKYDGVPKVYEYDGEHQGIYSFNNSSAICRVAGNKPVKSVSIVVYPEFFLAYLNDNTFCLPSPLSCILQSEQQAGLQFNCPLTNRPREILHQITECSFRGIQRKLFLESKALELLFLQLENCSTSDSCCAAACKMHPQDKKQTERARDLLLSNLETPPCLHELARSAGMSHPKLNRCFKQMYGMTAFQCLRHERLYRAKSMLEEEGLSVTETAYLVGYDSLSHFSQAYKKQFGTSPSSSLRVT